MAGALRQPVFSPVSYVKLLTEEAADAPREGPVPRAALMGEEVFTEIGSSSPSAPTHAWLTGTATAPVPVAPGHTRASARESRAYTSFAPLNPRRWAERGPWLRSSRRRALMAVSWEREGRLPEARHRAIRSGLDLPRCRCDRQRRPMLSSPAAEYLFVFVVGKPSASASESRRMQP